MSLNIKPGAITPLVHRDIPNLTKRQVRLVGPQSNVRSIRTGPVWGAGLVDVTLEYAGHIERTFSVNRAAAEALSESFGEIAMAFVQYEAAEDRKALAEKKALEDLKKSLERVGRTVAREFTTEELKPGTIVAYKFDPNAKRALIHKGDKAVFLDVDYGTTQAECAWADRAEVANKFYHRVPK